MTIGAARALEQLTGLAVDIGAQLDDRGWAAPSACDGWSVGDVFVHLTATFREIVAPDSLPPVIPGEIEKSGDMAVAAFRFRGRAGTLSDYRLLAPTAISELATMQSPARRHEPTAMEDCGTYPAHLWANALVFDHFCHLRHDLAHVRGGTPAAAVPATRAFVQNSLLWLIAGLTRMRPELLELVVDRPLVLELDGPGGGTWTVEPSATGALRTRRGALGATTVTCSGADFILWATRRASWRDCSVTVRGDTDYAFSVLDAIHLF